MRQQKICRNKAKLTSLGLLAPMTSAASPSADRTNRKKRVATQVDFVRRIQPKRNVFKPTSYKDLDDPVINKRMHLIDSSDTRRILAARGWTRWSTAPAVETTRRRTMRTS